MAERQHEDSVSVTSPVDSLPQGFAIGRLRVLRLLFGGQGNLHAAGRCPTRTIGRIACHAVLLTSASEALRPLP